MPSLDPLRGRISVTEKQLDLLRALSREQINPESAEVAALREAGLVRSCGTLHPLASDLVATMDQPVVEIRLETMSPAGATVSHVVVRNDEGLWYIDPWPDARAEREVAFVKEELPELTWIVGRLIGFRGRTRPSPAGRVGADRSSVESRLANVERAWRVLCTWGRENRPSRELAVWDCGSHGFWLRTTSVEPLMTGPLTAGGETAFVPTDVDLRKALTGFLPSGAELREAATGPGHGAVGGGRRTGGPGFESRP